MRNKGRILVYLKWSAAQALRETVGLLIRVLRCRPIILVDTWRPIVPLRVATCKYTTHVLLALLSSLSLQIVKIPGNKSESLSKLASTGVGIYPALRRHGILTLEVQETLVFEEVVCVGLHHSQLALAARTIPKFGTSIVLPFGNILVLISNLRV